MTITIDRVRISAAGKQQLSTLKRRTGIEHYNVICRHALCASLANVSVPPEEEANYSGGIEIDWKVFAGESDVVLRNILVTRTLADYRELNTVLIRQCLSLHLHRGLSYLASTNPSDGLDCIMFRE